MSVQTRQKTQLYKSEMMQTLERSLATHIDLSRPILLALSGGVDSMALLSLLVDMRKFLFPTLSIHAVHIDHQWREGSAQEALSIQKYAESLGIACFIHTLEAEAFNEEAARSERLFCFRKVMEATGSQAVCLGHHKGDQEETLIKRLFEGAGLTQLQGMREFSQRNDGLVLWRPLLSHSKAELIRYVEERKIPYWEDATNQDTTFLRARMRKELIPLISDSFGKQIGSGLHHLSYEAAQLQEYLESKLQETQVHAHQGPLGIYWHWPILPDRYLLRYQIKQLLQAHNVTLSRQELERAAQALIDGASNYCIRVDEVALFVDRDKLFFLKSSFLQNNGENEAIQVDLSQDGDCKFGSWHLEWKRSIGIEEDKATDWQSGWGECWIGQLVSGMYLLHMPSSKDCMLWKGKVRACKEVWSSRQVPVPLRSFFPLLSPLDCLHEQKKILTTQFLVKQPFSRGNEAKIDVYLRCNEIL